mmetsp:Transcript_20141/g.41753  ORF Transcript_20141/g.41753 Transcript_20141/m.41753 type:complete len:87 (-) Transcript_20141:1122-1382(-)
MLCRSCNIANESTVPIECENKSTSGNNATQTPLVSPYSVIYPSQLSLRGYYNWERASHWANARMSRTDDNQKFEFNPGSEEGRPTP